MSLLTQNGKMKKSSQNGIAVYNFTLPAFQSITGLKTCPNAGLCAAGCYARQGTYRFSNVARKHEANLALTLTDNFVQAMIQEIDSLNVKHAKKGQSLKIRIHDSGDFYSLEYASKWNIIMTHFLGNSNVSFYAYTKQVKMLSQFGMPANIRIIFSFGGKQDAMIDVTKDFHARVFESLDALDAAGYVDGTSDDMVAAIGKSNKIGLVYHGTKNFSNTKWDKVA